MQFEFDFESEIIEWRGPAPFLFAPVPDGINAEIGELAKTLSYGWGVVPVRAQVGSVEFTTSLIPRNGVFLVPLKVAVTKPNKLSVGDTVRIWMVLG